MNFTKWLIVLFAFLLSTLKTASATEPRVGDPEGVIFTAKQIGNQKYVTVPGPYWTPSQEQIDRLEKKLPVYLKGQSKSYSKPLKIDLSKYRRQYIGYSLSSNKVIYVNAFCHSFDYWKKTFVFVFDGGQCFFQVTFDPETDRFLNFSVNGDA